MRSRTQHVRHGLPGMGNGLSFAIGNLRNLAAWYRADQGITIGGTPLASGTTPPAVTYTGTLTGVSGLYVQIDGAGARGVATFKWSLDGGSTFQATAVLTAATVALSGAASAVTVNFPVGTYATNNIYRATTAQWSDLSGNVRHLLQATPAKQPAPIISAVNGQPALRFDTSAGMFLDTGAFTLNNPFSVYMIAKSITYGTAGVKDIWLDGESAGSMVIGSVLVGGYSISSGSAITYAAAVANGVYAYLGHVFGPGGTGIIRVNGTNQQTGSTGSSNAGGIHLGGLFGGTRGANFECAELIVLARQATATELVQLDTYAKGRYAL